MAIFSFEYGNRSIYRYYAWFLVLGCVFSVLNGFLIARPRALVHLPNAGARAWRPLSLSHAISKANAARLHAFKGFDISSAPVVTPAEQELFDLLLRVVHDCNLNTTIRVAGGWVRDRMLRTASQKFDVDMALENMTGVQFVQHLKQWVRSEGKELPEVFQLSVIPQNVEKSKHLETGNSLLLSLNVCYELFLLFVFKNLQHSDWPFRQDRGEYRAFTIRELYQ